MKQETIKQYVIFCTGLSGSGKTYFINNCLPNGRFHKLVSATTRPMRPGETDGRDYYFRDETYFDAQPLVTKLWVNEDFWRPGKPKWMYGVPEHEILNNSDKNLVYDVIQPRYVAQMIKWFYMRGMQDKYEFKILYFIPPENNYDIARARANMPDDDNVRRTNTCNPIDFLRVGLDIDFMVKCSPNETIISPRLQDFLHQLNSQR